ncbi:hypothetical protein [Mucilaginibacter paludis]|uniref:Uncharacterized protein n=1 Tax=Mucilaginibacter paludis DSM 18603 TaxID=714943 RepID=H1YD27_9SPHI|nr:hypothetical protein [Mucilaginibacter paludis]EHQ26084.1 hypothetical protein Mucpa_1937 [Mucilaginibacter paludis DSM 18603]
MLTFLKQAVTNIWQTGCLVSSLDVQFGQLNAVFRDIAVTGFEFRINALSISKDTLTTYGVILAVGSAIPVSWLISLP